MPRRTSVLAGSTDAARSLHTEKSSSPATRSSPASIGRTDLSGGDTQKIIRSLHNTVLTLPDDTVVVPGHGELTTIGEEREGNPFLVRR